MNNTIEPIALATSGQLPIDCVPQSSSGLLIMGIIGAIFWGFVFYCYWSRKDE